MGETAALVSNHVTTQDMLDKEVHYPCLELPLPFCGLRANARDVIGRGV